MSFHTGRMKANPRARSRTFRPVSTPLLTLATLTASAVLTSGCIPSPPKVDTTPTPSLRPHTPAPRPTPTPTPAPAAASAPTPRPLPEPTNWRDAPITPGDWSWAQSGPRSVAMFAAGQFAMRCDTRNRTVSLESRANGARGSVTMAITTVDGTEPVTAQARQGFYVATLPASSRLLDSMAFSRGRFAVAVQGQPTLYIPSWTEVSRVVEDCR